MYLNYVIPPTINTLDVYNHLLDGVQILLDHLWTFTPWLEMENTRYVATSTRRLPRPRAPKRRSGSRPRGRASANDVIMVKSYRCFYIVPNCHLPIHNNKQLSAASTQIPPGQMSAASSLLGAISKNKWPFLLYSASSLFFSSTALI